MLPNQARNIPFQSNFVYTFTDTTTKKILWTRKQPMDKKKEWSLELSPVDIYVSDSGWSAICLGGWEMLAVSREGRETGKVNILNEGLPKKEREKFVQKSGDSHQWR